MTQAEPQPPSHTIVYDAGCRFCRWSLGWVLRWDRHRRLRPLALDTEEANRLLAEIDPADRGASWHLVGPERTVRSAGAAAPDLLRLLPAGSPGAALLARVPRLTERAYRWVADHRSMLGRPIGERAVARADELIASRTGGGGPTPP
jgi:predicted DCC family thiol-disulfide oxidoreductase YuxK